MRSSSTPRPRASRPVLAAALAVAAVLLAAAPSAAAKAVLDFDGSLPAKARLSRASDALAPDGSRVGPDAPRFGRGLVAPGARRLVDLPVGYRVLGSGRVGNTLYTAWRFAGDPFLTPDTLGLDANPTLMTPAPAEIALYGTSQGWGLPTAASIFPNGIVLVHTTNVLGEARSGTIRSHVDQWERPGGHHVVRVGEYVAPPGRLGPQVLAFFTRLTWLPELFRYAVTITEYDSGGLVSSVYPGQGRALAYASTDFGASWQRVFDSDDPLLGGALTESPRHVHHLEPFVWQDPADGLSKIGAVALLGDGAGSSGQVVIRSPGRDFPDPDTGVRPEFARLRRRGVHQLTDLFPLDASERPGHAMRFLPGTDGNSSHQSGMALMSIEAASEDDAIVWRPTVPFVASGNQFIHQVFPYVFQLDRLDDGEIAAATWLGGSRGIWQASANGEHWAQVDLVEHTGYRGVTPAGGRRFWTLSEAVAGSQMSLFELGTGLVRRSLRLGPAARSFSTLASLGAPGVAVSEVTGQVAGPAPLPASARLFRVSGDSLANFAPVTTPASVTLHAGEGETLSLSFWAKPALPDLKVATLRAGFTVKRADGSTGSSIQGLVELGLNDWERISVPLTVPVGQPDQAVVSAIAELRMREDATPSQPLDWYLSEPAFVVASQPLAGEVPVGESVAADELSVTLPPLGPDWSVGIWGTEAMSFVASVQDGQGRFAEVAPVHARDAQGAFGTDAALRLATSRTPPTDSPAHTVFFPTEDLVVFTGSQADDRVRAWVCRGMGEPEELVGAPGSDLEPVELRLASADGRLTFEGDLHRIAIWDDRALDLAAVDSERTHFAPPPASPACGLGGEVALALWAVQALRRRRQARARPAAQPGRNARPRGVVTSRPGGAAQGHSSGSGPSTEKKVSKTLSSKQLPLEPRTR